MSPMLLFLGCVAACWLGTALVALVLRSAGRRAMRKRAESRRVEVLW